MTSPKTLKKARLRDQAYEVFTQRLLDEEIHPGQFLTQRELVELTNFSLGAIRELIPKLEADGLIHTLPQRGLQISPLDFDMVRNAFQLRLFLEREAVALFAVNADDALLARMREDHERVKAAAETAVTQDIVDQAQAVDWDLHDTIIDALDNKTISNIYRVNSIKIRLIRRRETRLNRGIVVPVMEDHLRIISAFEARDAHLAARELGGHINAARDRALAV